MRILKTRGDFDMRRKYKPLLFLLMILFVFSSCSSGQKDTSGVYKLNKTGEAVLNDVSFFTEEDTQDNNRVFYEIFVGSFSDSNGDGIGDLRGIINRLDYLNDGDPDSGLSLGVEGLWLSPIFKSGSYHKYDVNDYYAIDESFGTEADLVELLEECHARNVKVILDLPINHTGPLHAWFGSFRLAHRQGNTDDPYYDFYTYYHEGDTPPPGRVFQPLSGTDDYYECNFSGDMPELNYDSEAVRQAVFDIAKYYLDLGADGFRFDAAKYVYFGDHARSVEFWKWYIGELKKIKPDVYTVAEVWDSYGVTDLYYPALNCFDFTISQSNGLIAETAKKGNANAFTSYVEAYICRVQSMRSDAMLLPFIANHDTDRAAGYLTVASGQMQMAANLYILSPGSPFIYYGEELGMRGSRGGANTDANRRLAMLWGDGDTVSDPAGSTYDASKQIETTAKDQLADGNSLLSYYKRLIMIRKANPEIARGEYKALSIPSKMGGFTATWNGNTIIVLHNPTGSTLTIDLSAISGVPVTQLAAVIGMEDASLDGAVITLGASTSCVLR